MNKCKILSQKHHKVMIGILLAAMLVFPLMGFSQYVYRIAVVSVLYAILAMSLNLIAGVAGQISLGHIAFYGIGAYTSALLCVNFGVSVWVGILAAFVVSMLFGLLIAPLAGLARYFPTLGELGVSGTGVAPALIALTLYALLPLVRGVVTGLQQVPQDALESATAMGMSAGQRFRQVQLPLAMPVLLRSLRVVSVQTVGMAVVAALIGAGGFGALVFQGLLSSALDLVLLGVGHGDTRAEADKLWGKLRGLRINEDENGKTNLALADVDGEVLVVSQFTLFADCRHGRRPSFTDAGAPDVANELYEYFLTLVRQDVEHVAHGIFGADMKVDLVNDGPFTIVLDTDNL